MRARARTRSPSAAATRASRCGRAAAAPSPRAARSCRPLSLAAVPLLRRLPRQAQRGDGRQRRPAGRLLPCEEGEGGQVGSHIRSPLYKCASAARQVSIPAVDSLSSECCHCPAGHRASQGGGETSQAYEEADREPSQNMMSTCRRATLTVTASVKSEVVIGVHLASKYRCWGFTHPNLR